MEETEPPMKKMKTENQLSKTIDIYIEKLKECKSLKVVLGDDFDSPLPLVKVTVGHIKNPKDISKTILLLQEKVPLDSLTHLKRARNRDIILCPITYYESSIQSFLEQYVPELKDKFEYFKEIEVPSVAPTIKKQVSKIQNWSLNFHPNKYLESLLSDNFFPKDEIRFHITSMSMAFEVARWYLKDQTSPDLLKEVNATVVIDPTICSVVAVAFCNKDHPVQHSTMLAIDNVAKTQNGGAWGTSTNGAINCTLSGIDPDLLVHLKHEFRKVSIGARVFKSKRDDTSISENSDLNVDDTSESPYLCTGYHIYSLREPCLMCSMALVHARAKRIFFCFDNKEFGGLKSKTKLQTLKALNHRFEIFTGFLNEEK